MPRAPVQNQETSEWISIRKTSQKDVSLMDLVFSPMPAGESYRRRLMCLLLCLCDVFRAIINSPVCWFCCCQQQLVLSLSVSLRFGVSPLETHKLRYHKDVTLVHCSCPFCNSDVETEVHFILVCSKYAEIREQYIPKKYITSPSSFKLALLLATTSKVLLLRLAVYIMKAFTIRNA